MITMRDAQLEDAAALCAAEQAIVAIHDGLLVSDPDELYESAFRDRIAYVAEEHGKYLVVLRDSLPVAHACLWPMELRRISHVLRLDICVHLGHWRQGYGRALLQALIDWARTSSSAHKIELVVRATNLPAIALYRASGFVDEGRLRQRVRLRNGRYVDDLSMALILRHGSD
jgi:RimJ/RimL family protein N-acetyltransferase